MADELKHLLDRIQQDGFDKADADAKQRVESATKRAREIIAEAEVKAAALRKTAEQDAEVFAARARKAVQQAGRDVVLWVGESIQHLARELVEQDVRKDISGNLLQELIQTAVNGYCQNGGEVQVSADDQAKLKTWFQARMADALKKGVQLEADAKIQAGFKIRVTEQHVEHDFTAAAIADSMARLLRPDLAKLIQEVRQSPDE